MASHLDFQQFQVLLKSTHPLRGAPKAPKCGDKHAHRQAPAEFRAEANGNA